MSELKDVQKFIKQEIRVCDNPYYPMTDLSEPVKKGAQSKQKHKPNRRQQRRYTKKK